jgi:hypothetical protein
MQIRSCGFLILLYIVVGSSSAATQEPAGESTVPLFGRDTVLVYKIQNLDYHAGFVVRIAQFLPDRYLEWEDESSQGTVFMPGRDIEAAKGYNHSSLFKSGIDARGNSATTLWLSKRLYRDLKANKKSKCMIDGAAAAFTYEGDETLSVEVNGTSRTLPVIRVMDDRMEEWWFLDQEDNPLMVSLRVRKFSQTLSSITTDKANTLRWIKGSKLANPPR